MKPKLTLRDLFWLNPLNWISRAADWVEEKRDSQTFVRRQVRWFDKATLLEAIRFTNETQLGDPPSAQNVESSPDQRFPIVAETLHEKVPGVDWETFYRCCLYVQGQGYRVAVPPHVWEGLPLDEFKLPW